jgi:VWFA-related protein
VKIRAIALAAVITAVVALSPRAAGQSPQPVFRSEARLVQVSLIVQDRNGRPVPGLTAADFEVKESGKKHVVAHLAVQTRDALRAASASPPAGSFTNVLDGRVGTGATVLLFDRLNTSGFDQVYARRHIADFIRRLRPDERLGFYVLDPGSLRIINDFTADASTLLAMLDGVTTDTSVDLDRSEDKLERAPDIGDARLDALYAAMIEKSEQAVQAFSMERRVDATVETLEILAERLSGVRGRKNVIWVSSAFPLYFHDGISMQDMSSRVYRATRALSHADISIYPVDARGLVGGLSGPAGRPTHTTMAQLAPSHDASSIIAQQTGGKAFRNTNDLRAAMTRAVEDSELTYVLGYYPQDERFDGRFRSIDVKVKKPGVKVRHRSGYYAHPPKAAALEKDALIDALNFPVEATSLGLTVTHTASANGELMLTIAIDPSALSLQQKDGRWVGQLEVAIGQRLADRRLRNSAHVMVPVNIPDAMRSEFVKSGLTLSRTVPLDPAASLVVVGVRDLMSGAVGTVRINAGTLTGVGAGR